MYIGDKVSSVGECEVAVTARTRFVMQRCRMWQAMCKDVFSDVGS